MTKTYTSEESSHVRRVSYHPTTNTLQIQFANGTMYNYHNVPQNIYEDAIRSPSIGKFISAHIKMYYQYEKTTTVIS